jgi:hypothetical protein
MVEPPNHIIRCLLRIREIKLKFPLSLATTPPPHRWSRSKLLWTRNLSELYVWMASFTFRPLYSQRQDVRYPFHRRLCCVSGLGCVSLRATPRKWIKEAKITVSRWEWSVSCYGHFTPNQTPDTYCKGPPFSMRTRCRTDKSSKRTQETTTLASLYTFLVCTRHINGNCLILYLTMLYI